MKALLNTNIWDSELFGATSPSVWDKIDFSGNQDDNVGFFFFLMTELWGGKIFSTASKHIGCCFQQPVSYCVQILPREEEKKMALISTSPTIA